MRRQGGKSEPGAGRPDPVCQSPDRKDLPKEIVPIAVAVVNYNTREILRACLMAIQAEAPRELIVIDNASSDGSTEMVKSEFPSVRLFRNETNLGYGVAANQAITMCTAPYVLLLNSDALVQPGGLRAVGAYLDRNPHVAIAGPRFVNPDGTLQSSCFPFPTPLDIFLDASNLYRAIRRIPVLRNRFMRTWSHSYACQVSWVLGAALAIRRNAFEVVRGFDESFFMYYEDVDLCYRLTKAGWQVHFAPVTDIAHVGGASTSQNRAEMAVQLFASLVQFYRRHYSRIRFVELIALVECIALARLIRDAIAFSLTRDPRKRADLSTNNLRAWRRLLVGHWHGQEAPSQSPDVDNLGVR